MIAYFLGEPIARFFHDKPGCQGFTPVDLENDDLQPSEVLFLPEGYSVDEDFRPTDLGALVVGVCEVISPDLDRLPDGCFYYNGWPVPAQAQGRALEVVAPEATLHILRRVLAPMELTLVEAPATSGMVSARVIAMIINEAHLLLQEGAASADDIDLSMKLGTGYPIGPFAWEQLWGTHKTRALLAAMAEQEPEVVLPYWDQKPLEAGLR